jgi:CheY-like chemotaxis protein
MDKLRALVIDDSPETIKFVVDEVLKPYGFSIDTAVDGSEGLRKALDAEPHLVIMDFEMPMLTGLDVLRELRRRDSKVPVILMTSHRSEQIAMEIFHLGVNAYVMKPFTPDQMEAAIDQAMYLTRLQRENAELSCQFKELEQQYEQYIHQLNALYYISKSMADLVPPSKFLERIVEAVLFVTRSEECVLALIDPEMGQLQGHLRRRRAAGEAAAVETVPAAESPETADSSPGDHSHRPSESVLSVPLQVGQKVVGTLSITKQISGRFTWQDDRLLRILADYAALAIYNLQLLRRTHTGRERRRGSA